MEPQTYYLIAALGVMMTILFGVYSHIDSKNRTLETKVETNRVTAENHYNETLRKMAELGERLATERLDRTRDMQVFVTRGELDRRMDRFEKLLAQQNEKADEVLRHVSGLPLKKGI